MPERTKQDSASPRSRSQSAERPSKRTRFISFRPTSPQPEQGGSGQHDPKSRSGSPQTRESEHEHEKQKPKRGRKPSSCAECRRMKLKCNRVFPCESCIKRGCEAICPEGSLVSGKGTRYVLANTEQLHDKLTQMAERIRNLEDALATLHTEHSRCALVSAPDVTRQQRPTPTHPLLCGEGLRVKCLSDVYTSGLKHGDVREAYESEDGAKAIESIIDTGHTLGFDRLDDRSPAEQQFEFEGPDVGLSSSDSTPPPPLIPRGDLPAPLIGLAAAFTGRWKTQMQPFDDESGDFVLGPNLFDKPSVDVRDRVRSLMPPYMEAARLCRLAVRHSFWMINHTIDSATAMRLLVPVCDSTVLPEDLDAGDLALILMLLSIGTFIDTEPSQSLLTSEDYYALSRAVLYTGIDAAEGPELRIAQCLFLRAWYLLLISDRKHSPKEAHGFIGWLSAVVQSLGLERESTYQEMEDEEEAQEQRIFFWEVLYIDSALSIALSQPSMFASTRIDCRRPTRGDLSLIIPSQMELSFIDSKFDFVEHLAEPFRVASRGVVEHSPDRIIDLDSRIRRCFDIESILDGNRASGDSLPPEPILTLLRTTFSQARESDILHLHRATCSNMFRTSLQPMYERAYPSLLATLRSACLIGSDLSEMFMKYPQVASRLSKLWYTAFCVATALFIMIETHPSCPMCAFALSKMLHIVDLFGRAAPTCTFAAKAWPLLTQLANKAADGMQAWKNSLETLDKAEVAESMKAHNSAIMLRSQCIFKRVKSASTRPPAAQVASSSASAACSSDCTPDEPLITCFGDAHADTDIYTAIHPELLAFFEYLPEGLKFSQNEIDSLTLANRQAALSAGHPPLNAESARAQGAGCDWAVLADVLMQAPGYEEAEAEARQARDPLRPFLHIASPEEHRRKRAFAMAPASAHPRSPSTSTSTSTGRTHTHVQPVAGPSRLGANLPMVSTTTTMGARRSDSFGVAMSLDTAAFPTTFDDSNGGVHHRLQHQQHLHGGHLTEPMMGLNF